MTDDSRVLKTIPGLAGTVDLAQRLQEAITPGACVRASLEEAPDLLVSDLQALAAAHLTARRRDARLAVEMPAGGRLESAIRRAGFDGPSDAALLREGDLWTGVRLPEGRAA